MWQHGLPTVGGFFHLEGCTVASPVSSGGCSVCSYPVPFGVHLGLLPSLVAASSFLPLRGDRLRLRAVLFYLWLASPPVGSVGEVTAAGFRLGFVVRGSPRVAKPLGLRGSIASTLRAPRIVVSKPATSRSSDDGDTQHQSRGQTPVQYPQTDPQCVNTARTSRPPEEAPNSPQVAPACDLLGGPGVQDPETARIRQALSFGLPPFSLKARVLALRLFSVDLAAPWDLAVRVLFLFVLGPFSLCSPPLGDDA